MTLQALSVRSYNEEQAERVPAFRLGQRAAAAGNRWMQGCRLVQLALTLELQARHRVQILSRGPYVCRETRCSEHALEAAAYTGAIFG